MTNPYNAPAPVDDTSDRSKLPRTPRSRFAAFAGVLLAITSALMVGYALLLLVNLVMRVGPEGWTSRGTTGVSARDIVFFIVGPSAASGIVAGIAAFYLLRKKK